MDPAIVALGVAVLALALFFIGLLIGKMSAEMPPLVPDYQGYPPPSLKLTVTTSQGTAETVEVKGEQFGQSVRWDDRVVYVAEVESSDQGDLVYGDPPKEPYSDECTDHEKVGENGVALWYPQMGGYSGRAVALRDEAGHYDVWVWHDGAFPFSSIPESNDPEEETDRRSPVCIHHCDPGQFIQFGEDLLRLLPRPVEQS